MLAIYLKRYPLTILTTIAIIILSLMPFPEIEIAEDIPFYDKWAHFVMYGFLSLIAWIENARSRVDSQRERMLVCVIIPGILGGVLELAQEYLTTTRNGDWWDFLADLTGVVLGSFVGLIILLNMKKKKEN